MPTKTDRWKVPHYRITSMYEDGSTTEPELYSVVDLRGDWGASRKEFLQVSAALGLIGCCVIGAIADAFDDDDETPSTDTSPSGTPGGASVPAQEQAEETVAPEPAGDTDDDDDSGSNYGVGGYTYCQCDQICTCIPIV